ncbi:MAG: LPS assembly lipoprotein LptE [Elusimicrobiota bacterium]
MKRLAGRLRILIVLCSAGLLSSCGGSEVIYKPSHQILPAHIRRIAVRPVVNKTQQFGLEDKLTLRIRDEFLRNGQYRILPENLADGVVAVTVTRYILTPTQYDSVLAPTAYKLLVLADLQFINRHDNTILWTEPSLDGIQNFTAPTLAGGITEEQARELIWDTLARDIVTRTVDGFGSVTGVSQREISGQAPPNQPAPLLRGKPINPAPY